MKHKLAMKMRMMNIVTASNLLTQKQLKSQHLLLPYMKTISQFVQNHHLEEMGLGKHQLSQDEQ